MLSSALSSLLICYLFVTCIGALEIRNGDIISLRLQDLDRAYALACSTLNEELLRNSVRGNVSSQRSISRRRSLQTTHKSSNSSVKAQWQVVTLGLVEEQHSFVVEQIPCSLSDQICVSLRLAGTNAYLQYRSPSLLCANNVVEESHRAFILQSAGDESNGVLLKHVASSQILYGIRSIQESTTWWSRVSSKSKKQNVMLITWLGDLRLQNQFLELKIIARSSSVTEQQNLLQTAPVPVQLSEKVFDYRAFSTELVHSEQTTPSSLLYVSNYMRMFVSNPHRQISLRVNREHAYEGAFSLLMTSFASLELFRPALIEPVNSDSNIRFIFENEIGEDRGGLTRAFFPLAVEQATYVHRGLFEPVQHRLRLRRAPPHPIQDFELRLQHLICVGRLLAWALLSNVTLHIRFAKSVYLALSGRPLPERQKELLSLVKEEDPDIAKHLAWFNNANMDNYEDTFYFECTVMTDQGLLTDELIPDGSSIAVTESNKESFITEYAKWVLYGRSRRELDALSFGFRSILPPTITQTCYFDEEFSAARLKKRLEGQPVLTLREWKRYTLFDVLRLPPRFVMAYQAEFWRYILNANQLKRAKLLRFVTGSSSLPSGGFRDLTPQFTVRFVARDDILPASHTCTNTLDLPWYNSGEILNERLDRAIEETTFELA